MTYNRILRTITVVFVCFVVILTFFARTLADINLPRVSTAFLSSGVIAPEAVSSGIANHSDEERVFAPAGGRITQILGVGSEAREGDVLFTITTEMDTLLDRLELIHHEERLNNLSHEQIENDRAENVARLSRLRNDPLPALTPPVLNVWEIESQIEANIRSINTVALDIESLWVLYDAGAVPRADITRREADLYDLIVRGDNLRQNLEAAIARHYVEMQNYQAGIDRARRDRNEQIRSLESTITGFDFGLARAELEAVRISQRRDELLEQIETGGVIEFRLENSGLPYRIVEFNPAIDIGASVAEDMWVMTLSPINNRFTIYAPFSNVHEFVRTATEAVVRVGDEDQLGEVVRLRAEGMNIIAVVEVVSRDLMGGELVQVTVRGNRHVGENTVPIAALREDDQGHYILYVTSEAGTMGSNYFANVFRVEVAFRDNTTVALSARWVMDFPEEPIIIRSDMPVRPGDRVRLVAANSFTPSR